MTRLPVPAALTAVIALALLPPTLRAETELYGGIGIGYSTFKVSSEDFEGSDLTTSQFLGVTFGDYLSLEAGYLDFGSVNDRVVIDDTAVNENLETWGYDVTLLGRYPLNDDLDALGRIGVLRWDSERSIDGSFLKTKTDGDDLMWGLGLEFRGSGRTHLRVEGEFVNIEFANSWWVLSASILYSFPFGR